MGVVTWPLVSPSTHNWHKLNKWVSSLIQWYYCTHGSVNNFFRIDLNISRLLWNSCSGENILMGFKFNVIGQKTYSTLFILASFDLGWQNLLSLKTKLPASEQIMLQIWLLAQLNLNRETNKTHLHNITHGNNCVDVICSATGDTKHLPYKSY